jgi:1-acyl-sn-glycerol-3-phosphate acyltransferase
MKPMRSLRNLLAWLLAALTILLLCLPALPVIGAGRRGDFLLSASRRLSKMVLRITGVSVRLHAAPGIDFSRPLVMVCNHLSNLDGPLLYSVLPCVPRALIKNEARRIPLIGWMLKLAGFVFVARQDPLRRQQALDEAVEKIKKKRYSFLVFPEGTRRRNGPMKRFRKGSFTIALRAGVSVLPIRISGSQKVLPPGRMAVRAGAVDIELLDPLDLAGLRENDLAEWTQRFQYKFFPG